MVLTRKQVLQKIDKFKLLRKKNRFVSRVCKLIKDGEFNGVFSSSKLIDLLNEGPGKNFQVGHLTALMNPLIGADIVRVFTYGNGGNKKKYWRPAWIDRRKAEDNLALISSEDKVLFLTGKDAWTDSNQNLPIIINTLKGDLCIVDKFYGNGTLSILAQFGKGRRVKFLSAELGKEEQENIAAFDINLRKFKSQFGNIKLKKYDKFWELHDRYILADNALVVIGHGIKDFGNKESFVIFLPKKEVLGFLPVLRNIFEKRWSRSRNI